MKKPFQLFLIVNFLLLNSCVSTRLENRVTALESGLYDVKESNKRLSNQMSDLEKRLGELDNSIFILKDLMDSTSAGLKELKEGAAGLKKAETPAQEQPQPGPAIISSIPPEKNIFPKASEPEITDPYLFYRKAYDYFQAGDYASAQAKFSRFVEVFPRHDLSDNALYWMGECYYSQKDFPSAIQTFERVYRDFPEGNKVPDALLKLGYSYISAGNQGKAKEVIQKLIQEYPHSEAANKAKEKLRF